MQLLHGGNKLADRRCPDRDVSHHNPRLGFGAKPPAPEWGYMLNEGRACIQSAPWIMIFPGLAIFVVVVVFNMLGDSLRDILDPKDE